MTPSDSKLQSDEPLPRFSAIDIARIEPQLEQLLADNRAHIEQLLATLEQPGWDTLVAPIEEWQDRLEKFWAPVSHLNGVRNTEQLREAYEACLPKLTEYGTWLGQHEGLYDAYRRLADSEAYAQLQAPQRKAVDNALRDFRLCGVALPADKRSRFAELQQALAQQMNRFANNVLDATQGWYKHVTDEAELAGVPPTALDTYRQAAASRELDGFVVTLDAPSYLPAMQYADNRELRRELYTAYVTRASDQGPCAGQWDNSATMEQVLALRHELAGLLGFANYAELSLATKMADTPDQVERFLEELSQHGLAAAREEFAELQRFAAARGAAQLEAWDVPYYAEQLRLEKYAISQEQLRPYFPVPKVMEGLFAVTGRLFGIRFEPMRDVDTWHPDVTVYQLCRGDEVIARCYFDLYAREKKRGGAWMADCRARRLRADGELQLPVAFLTCNFTPPAGERPSLLTHDEVTTLFHEFGHGLHHMLTEIDCAAVSGINGVEWDAVELPSQLLENWCWQPEALALISGHVDSGEPLPEPLLDKLLAAKNFQSAMQLQRQLEFALFDLLLHRDYNPDQPEPIQAVLDRVRERVAVYPVPACNRFQHGFSHIFAGGYAAGYYSYKWAEVLSADAFSRFEEEGVFNPETGRALWDKILSRGGSRDALTLFVDFRGREPKVDALLRHTGIK